MQEFQQIVDWFFGTWKMFYDYFTGSDIHPIFQMKIFLPLALLVVGLFISFVRNNERSV